MVILIDGIFVGNQAPVRKPKRNGIKQVFIIIWFFSIFGHTKNQFVLQSSSLSLGFLFLDIFANGNFGMNTTNGMLAQAIAPAKR